MFNSNMYNPQPAIDRINGQMAELERMKQQLQQTPPVPTNLTQNFQLAPTSRDLIKYAASMEEVQRDMVLGDTPYFSKDMSVVWIKNTKGDIKTYELNEIVPQDEKDIKIAYLEAQIEELKKGMNTNEQRFTDADGEYDEASSTESYESAGATTKENKPSSISRISKGKK